MNDLIFYAMLVLSGLAMLIFYGRRRSIKSVFTGMLSGGGLLVLLHFFGGALGYAPPLSLFNTAVSLILGIPGVIMIVVVNMV